jgi:hypothetical protein
MRPGNSGKWSGAWGRCEAVLSTALVSSMAFELYWVWPVMLPTACCVASVLLKDVMVVTGTLDFKDVMMATWMLDWTHGVLGTGQIGPAGEEHKGLQEQSAWSRRRMSWQLQTTASCNLQSRQIQHIGKGPA